MGDSILLNGESQTLIARGDPGGWGPLRINDISSDMEIPNLVVGACDNSQTCTWLAATPQNQCC